MGPLKLELGEVLEVKRINEEEAKKVYYGSRDMQIATIYTLY